MDYYDLARLTRHASWAAFCRDRPAGRLVLLTTAGATRACPRRFSGPTTSCCSAAKAPACRPRSMRAADLRGPDPAAGRGAVAQCRPGGRDGIERGPSPDLGIRKARMTAKPTRTATGPNGPSPLPDEATVARRKEEAATWFAGLRDRICAEFETIEDELHGHRTATGRPAASSARPGSATKARTARIAAAAPCR